MIEIKDLELKHKIIVLHKEQIGGIKVIDMKLAYDEQNQYVHKKGDVGSIMTDGSSPKHNNRVIEYEKQEYKIRKLTPKECWRLQGFTDEQFEKAKQSLNDNLYNGKDRSSSQLYKQAGNSITVDVLYYIYKQLYEAMPYLFKGLKMGSYFSGIGAFEAAMDKLFNDISGNE